MAIYIEKKKNNTTKVIHYNTDSKIDKAVETLLQSNENLDYAESLCDYSVDVVPAEDVHNRLIIDFNDLDKTVVRWFERLLLKEIDKNDKTIANEKRLLKDTDNENEILHKNTIDELDSYSRILWKAHKDILKMLK